MNDADEKTYTLRDRESGATIEVKCASEEEAVELLEDWISEGWLESFRGHEDQGTIWMDGEVLLDGEKLCGMEVSIDPPEPKCKTVSHNHKWCSPHELLGGCEENPGVFGKGGSVVVHCVCKYCGVYKVVDYWAQNPTNGEQGKTSVIYKPADKESLKWVRDRLRR